MDLRKIIDGCISNDRTSQESLYNLFKENLYILCLKYCRNPAEAEDNLHNSFLEIFSNIKKYNGKGSFEGWAKRITINKAIDSYKKTLDIIPIVEYDLIDTTIDEDEINVSADVILELVQNLPNQYRLVFTLYELDDYSHKEISTMLSISESTSKSNLHRAKVILKEKLLSNLRHQYLANHGK